ncbi:MAG: cysteine hydrolase family protein [Anaerolineae bacterium]
MLEPMMTDLAEKIDPRHTALLVVDMQNDYGHPDGALARDGRDVSAVAAMVPRLAALLEAARRAGTKIIFVRTTHDEWTDSPARTAHRLFRKMYVCRSGSWGAEFYGVSPGPDDHVITKHRYSAFIDTTLDLTLRSLGARTVIVTGTATHVCVDCTARDAFQRDYFVVVPADCTASFDPQLQETALANLDRYFGQVTISDKIVRAWAAPDG